LQIPELLTQRKFVSAACSRFLSFLRSASLFQQCAAHSNAHKPPQNVTSTVLLPELLTQRKFVSVECHAQRFGVQICELLTQRKFVSAMCHAHSDCSQTAQNCGSYSFDARVKILTEKNCYHPYLSIAPKKTLPRPL